MAIVIKVKADTTELERDIEKAAKKAGAALNSGLGQTGSAVGGGNRLDKLNAEFANAQKALDDLAKKTVPVSTGMTALGKSAGLAGIGIAAVAAAAIAATRAIIDMGIEGGKLANQMLDTAKQTGKTLEEVQKLESGFKDLTPRLRELGAVLDYATVKKAAEGANQFKILNQQIDAMKVKVGAELSGAFQTLGTDLQNFVAVSETSLTRLAGSLNGILIAISPVVRFLLQATSIAIEAQRMFGAGEFFGFGGGAPAVTGGSTIAVAHRGPRVTLGAESRDFFRSGVRTTPTPAARIPGGGGARLARGGGGSAAATGLPGGAQAALDQNAFFFSDVMGRTMFQLADQADKTSREIQKLTNDMLILEDRGLGKTTEATEIFNKIIQETGNLAQLNANKFLLLNKTLEGLPILRDTTGISLAGAAAPPIAIGGIPGQPTFSAGEAGAPISAARQREAEQLFDEITRQAIEFKQTIVFTFESAFREGFERGPRAFLNATLGAVKNFFAQMAAELSTGVIEMVLFGRGGATGKGVGGGGLLGGLGALGGGGGGGFGGIFGGGGGGGGGGGLLGGLLGGFGGGGGGVGLAPALSSGIRLGAGGGGFPVLTGGTLAGAGGAGAAGFSLLGTIAGPAAIGGLLGTALGGKSLGGKILGGIGGGIAGIGVGIGAAVGLAGGSILAGALAATGFGLLAAPFIIGAVLLGKAKQRKNDEQAADAIWVSERDQIRQLISDVNADRIDGASALAAAQSLRLQTVSGLNQIKTKSVRESRLSNQLRDLDNSVVAELRAAVARQQRRSSNAGFLVPEFAGGGYVPGIDRGTDSVTARVRPGELVLNREQQRRVEARAGASIFQSIGVARGGSYQAGGYVPAIGGGGGGSLTIEMHVEEGIVVGKIQSSSGERVIVNTVKKARRNGDL